MSLVYANGLLIVMVLLEVCFLKWFRKVSIPWREIIFNLNSGHIMLWVFRGVELSTYHFIYSRWELGVVDGLHPVVIWSVTFILWDFCFYWLHRLHHTFKLLWAVHVVHHEGEHFGLSLGIRNSWYSSLASVPFFIIIALIGVPTEIFLTISSLHYFIQFYNHNQVVRKSGWLEYMLITPSHHRVHHGKNPEYIDKNFGGTLVVWDKLFGTFQVEMEDKPVEFGTHDSTLTDNVILANNLPFAKLFRKTNPLSSPKPKRYFQLADGWVATAGIGLFGLLLCFIGIEQIWPPLPKGALFAIILLGTIGCGGISEGKYWGMVLWSINFLVLAPAVAWYLEWQSLFLLVPLALLGLHALALFFYVKLARY